jgi:hypothetical protein
MNLSRELDKRRTAALLPPRAQRPQGYAEFLGNLTLVAVTENISDALTLTLRCGLIALSFRWHDRRSYCRAFPLLAVVASWRAGSI